MPETSVRLALLEKASARLAEYGAATPRHVVVDHRRLPRQDDVEALRGAVEELAPLLLAESAALRNDQILVRVCPLDDARRPDLSFAGVFKSYLPRRGLPRRQHLTDGILVALASRHRPFADYYYRRHAIDGDRTVDLILAECVRDAAIYGTVYVQGARLLAEYFDCPLAIHLNDPERFAASRRTRLEGVQKEIADCALGLHDWLESPLDIEFVFDRRGNFFVTELRPISAAHLANWRRVSPEAWIRQESGKPPANVVNSVGERTGWAVDLRDRTACPEDFEEASGKVYFVRHGAACGCTSMFQFLLHTDTLGLSDLAVVVDHGRTRVDDHLQYAAFEDPGLSFVANAAELPAEIPNGRVRVACDGFEVRLR